jgi:hypothetical protein
MWISKKSTALSAVAAAAAITLSMLGLSSPAFADDAAPPADPVVVAAPAAETPAPDPAPVVVTPEAPAPAVAAPAAPAAEADPPAVTESTNPAPSAPATAPEAAKVPTDSSPAPPEKECKVTASFKHTYDSSANSGVITAKGEFCGKTFYVTPTEWAFTGNSIWGQDLVDTTQVTISKAGEYAYGNAVTCGQGDIYAQWDTPVVPSAHLSGPSVEFKEKFLSDYSKGPTTYVVQHTSCYIPPVHTTVTPKYDYSVPTCNTETYKVEGTNTLVLTGQEGVVWTITKGTDTQTLAAGAGFNAEPPFGVGTYTITGADASSNDLIDVTPVTAMMTFVSADSIECAAPPVVVAPSATIVTVCTADGPQVTVTENAGTNDSKFRIYTNGFQGDETTVPAGTSVTSVITPGEDTNGGSITVQVKSGELSLTDLLTVSTDCNNPVAFHPPGPVLKCGVYSIPGSTLDSSEVLGTDPETGAVVTASTYTITEGAYYVTDNDLNGVHTFSTVFVTNSGYVVADPINGEYSVSEFDGVVKYAIYESPKDTCAPVVTPPTTTPPTTTTTTTTTITKLASTGTKLASTGAEAGTAFSIGSLALLAGLVLAAFAAIRRRKAENQQ